MSFLWPWSRRPVEHIHLHFSEFQNLFLAGEKQRDEKQISGSSPFWDKAESHTFSDWLAPYLFGVGSYDLSEFHFGGLPDLSSFLERGGGAIHLKRAEWSKILKHRTKFGKLLAKEIRGKAFLDFGCGRPDLSVVPRLVAEALEACCYVGVDTSYVGNEVRMGEFAAHESSHELASKPKSARFNSYFFKQDLLLFLKSWKRDIPSVYFFAGLEAMDLNHSVAQKYKLELLNELNRKAKSEDLVIFGAGCTNIEIDSPQFKLIHEDPYHLVYKKK